MNKNCTKTEDNPWHWTIPTPRCLNCDNYLLPVKDELVGRYTGYLWKCITCAPDKILSIG